jgi:hypothetical protein
MVNALPWGLDWSVDFVEVEGDLLDNKGKPRVEVLELWRKNILDIIPELIGNLAFTDSQYAPIQVCEDTKGQIRVYSEMCIRDLWWELQVSSQQYGL